MSCHEARRFTFSDVLERADRLAAGLQQLGLKSGDRVGIWAHNSSTSYLTSLAVARAGMILVSSSITVAVEVIVISVRLFLLVQGWNQSSAEGT